MLFQHDMTVITVYDHEDDYQEIFAWLKENSCWFFPMFTKDGFNAVLSHSEEECFKEKFGIVIGRSKADK